MADQLAEDKKLIERIDSFAKGLNDEERRFIENSKRRLEGGRPLSGPMRQWAQDIDDAKVS